MKTPKSNTQDSVLEQPLDQTENIDAKSTFPNFNKITSEILSRNLDELTKEQYLDIVMTQMGENHPVMFENEIKSLYEYYVKQNKKLGNNRLVRDFGINLFGYLIDNSKDPNTKESTLDRAYRVLYDVAEKYPKEISDLTSTTNPVDEYVNSDIFFDTYLKIIDSPVLNKYFGGKQFSSLEYNMTYCGTDKYVESLLKKINFTESKSCKNSSELMNLAAYLANYAKEGSYSGKYNVDGKIIDGLKPQANKPDSIYLLGSKANYIIDRLEKGYHPFNHSESIFELSPGVLASYRNKELFVLDSNDPSIMSQYLEYNDLSKELNTPPKHLIDAAIKAGRDYVDWEPDRDDMFIKKTLEDSLVSKMSPINFKSLSGKEIENFKLKEYINLVGTDYRIFLEDEFKFHLSSFTPQEQFYFLEYIQIQTNESVKPVKEFTAKYGDAGFRTFLSLEHGGKEMGDKILKLGDKLQKKTASKLFSKYSEIIHNISNIVEFTKSNFTKEIDVNPELISKIEDTLYIKGKRLLEKTHEDIDKDLKIDEKEIEQQLDRINADTITTFAIFKQAVKNGEKLPIESIEGSVFSKKNASEVPIKQQEEMVNLYEINWKNHPDRVFVESLKSYFKTAFVPESNQPNNYFYTFEKDSHTRAFLRFERQQDQSLYASALNVDEASKSFGLGEAMMDEALTREAKEHILHASCRKDNPSNMRYFEKGFISGGFKKTNDTEEFDLTWNEKKNINIVAKQKTVEELVLMYLKETYEGSIEIRKSLSLEGLHSDIPDDKALVRCFQDPLQKNSWYAVYETIPNNYGVNEGETK